MNKFRKCLYTFLLLITCLVASPLIFRQIWKSSKDVEPASSRKPPVIDLDATISPESTSESITGEFTETTTSVTEEITTEPVQPEPLFIQSDPSYFDDALFIGDSRTVGLYEYGTLKNADYFCSVGLASYKIDSEYVDGYSIYDKLSANQYGKIYVMLGINECGNDFDYTMNAFHNLIDTISEYQPDAYIYILASLHVTQARQSQGDTITNNNIDRLNVAQSEFADNKQVFYLNVNEIFDDSEGNLMFECSNDGVHVLAKYYQTWCEWLCRNTVPVETSEENTDITTDATFMPDYNPETTPEVYNDIDNDGFYY